MAYRPQFSFVFIVIGAKEETCSKQFILRISIFFPISSHCLSTDLESCHHFSLTEEIQGKKCPTIGL